MLLTRIAPRMACSASVLEGGCGTRPGSRARSGSRSGVTRVLVVVSMSAEDTPSAPRRPPVFNPQPVEPGDGSAVPNRSWRYLLTGPRHRGGAQVKARIGGLLGGQLAAGREKAARVDMVGRPVDRLDAEQPP